MNVNDGPVDVEASILFSECICLPKQVRHERRHVCIAQSANAVSHLCGFSRSSQGKTASNAGRPQASL